MIGVRGYALPEGAPVELYAGVDGVEHGQHLDPRTDLGVLDSPARVVLRGRVLR